MDTFDFVKEFYYFNTLEQFIEDKTNIYMILDYIIYNGKFFKCKFFNLCNAKRITKATFKAEINRLLKEDNLNIRRLDINNSKVREVYNINNFIKMY